MENQRPTFRKDPLGPSGPEHPDQLDLPQPPPYSGQYNGPEPGSGGSGGGHATPAPAPAPAPVPAASVSTTSPGFPQYPGMPRIDYRTYSPPLSKLSSDLTTLVTKAEFLSISVDALATFIRSQAAVPPKPQVRVRGVRGRKVDFDVRLNLMNLLIPDDSNGATAAGASRPDHLRCAGPGDLTHRGGAKPSVLPIVREGDLEEWCRRFVADSGSVKTFALERSISNLDTEWLEGQIRSLVAALDYRGVVQVSFPVTHRRVVVQSPDIVHPLITSVAGFFAGKSRYEVARAVWPFANKKRGECGRSCAVQAEDAWWKEWKGSIRHAIANKRHGWVTVEDRFEALMEGKGNESNYPIEWGPDN